MKQLKDFSNSKIQFVFTDIDDTLTLHGKLPENSYNAIWQLSRAGFMVIPVTGRPAGWCEMIARFWPVAGVIGENGGLYYRYTNKKMKRSYAVSQTHILKNRKKLDKISKEILKKVRGSAIASDQFCRIFDLAIDFCEDVKPLSKKKVDQIVEIFTKHKASVKVSSIHVNGWFGKYDKLKMCGLFMKKEFGIDIFKDNTSCVFIGDSPNDEPMFRFFENSFAVQNIINFLDQIQYPPQFVTPSAGADGFTEFADQLLTLR